jgi:hypothetical protein
MIVRTPVTFRYLRVSATLLLFMAGFWPVGYASGQPLFEGDLACPAGSPSGQQVAHGLLSALTDPTKGNALNTAWEQAEPQIEQQTITLSRVHIPDGCTSDVDHFCASKLAFSHCSFVYVDIELHALTGLAPLRFTTDVQSVNQQRDVAAHTNPGPDAGKITDGVFAPTGHDSADPAYAIVLPHNGAASALVIDLGDVVNICGTGSGCTEPTLQADNDDVYQLDYSSDGMNWTNYGQFPTVSGSGLHTRSLKGSNFTAQYVRVWASSGGATFSVSELQLWDIGNNLVSVGKPAVGPRPSQITDGVFAPTGHSSTDTQYAVVLVHNPGPAAALVIDLEAVMTICGNGWDCLSAPLIQADNDDVYGFDYSTDGKNWTTYPETFPSVSGSGLQKRNVPQCNARPDLTQPCGATNHNPNFTARYVRVYAVSGGATFSVSELQLWDISSKLMSVGKPTYGPEPFETNGEFAPEGADWNDSRYATVLAPCRTASTSICPTSSAQTAAQLIDLTASFPVDQLQLVLQADNHQFQVDSSTDGQAWTPLWTVPAVSGSGLRTRTSPTFSSKEARYLRVYGTAGSDDNYSVSELQVITPQANTAGAYDGGANDGQNFACSYDGLVNTVLGVANGSSVQPFSTLPIQFYVDSVSLNAHCVTSTDGGDYNIAAAHDRQCSMTLVPPSGYAAPFTDQWQAGYCAEGLEILSYVHFDDSGDTSENTAIQFAAKDCPLGQQCHGTVLPESDLLCSDWDSLDPHIPDVLRGLVPAIAAGATQAAVNTILDYHPPNNHVVPFPRDLSQSNHPPLKCAGALTVGEPPTPSPDNISGLWGRAMQVGRATNSANLRILGRFLVEEPLALEQAALTLDALLREIGGAGELVQGPAGSLFVPLSLQPLKGSKPDKGIYRTPPGAKPIVHAQVAPVKGLDAQSGLMEFSIDVERATILGPAGCAGGPPPTAPLTTSFRLVGGSEAPVWVHTTADWQCNGTQLKIP